MSRPQFPQTAAIPPEWRNLSLKAHGFFQKTHAPLTESHTRNIPHLDRDPIHGDMSTLGTIALAFAVPIYLLVLHALFSVQRPLSPDRIVPDNTMLATLSFALLWCCLAVALASAIASGRFEWVAKTRFIQFLLILSAHLATGFITVASIRRRHHPAQAIPVCLRPIAPWAAFVLPPTVLLIALFALHPPLGYSVPPGWLKAALGFVGVLSIVATTALVIECFARKSRPPST